MEGWESLTEREKEVAELVADGMTNREVAERLFVTPATVKNHLLHIYPKLGISRRGELARERWSGRQGPSDRDADLRDPLGEDG